MPREPGWASIPAESLEHVVLDAYQFLFREAWVGDPMSCSRARAAQHQYFQGAIHLGLLEAQPTAAHQQQTEHIAELDTGRLCLLFQTNKTVEQQFIVH